MYSINNTLRTSTRSLQLSRAIFAQSLTSKPIARPFHTTKPNMTIHNIETLDQFKEFVASNPAVILDAFATWCGPCKAIAPQLATWSNDSTFQDKIAFAKFDVDQLPQLAQELGIKAMPTFTFFKDGKQVDEFVGANPPALKALLEKHAA